MANNDPVSGLMASMSRIRGRRPDGVAGQAATAAQAGTVLPTQRPAQPQAMPASVAMAAPPVGAVTPAPQVAATNPLIEAVRPSQPAMDPEVGRLTGLFVTSFPGLDASTAGLLAQQYLNEQRLGVQPEAQPGQSLPTAQA